MSIRKGAKVIYKGKLYEVWQKEKNFVKIFIPDAPLPELTMVTCGVNNVKKIKFV